ncbi:surfeit locus protein 2 [Conger conger]|uniref:surfeit locus protein 2 n=1 Tax=Conger conger TaxID=82655 RepID=UPI002A59947B|nr:surfeit locus protein 2 [Conger conger]
MEEVPADVRSFIKDHPFLQLTEAKKVKCALNGHEFPCNLKELQSFTSGKKYEKLSAVAQFNYSQYEPHVVPSTKQPNHLFCKLTLRHINRLPHHVLRHVNGKRYQRALQKYEECVRQGVAFVPVSLQQKKPRGGGGEGERGRDSKRGNGFWEPTSSDGEDGDSDDSMSDLYPSTVFTLKGPQHGEEGMAEAGGSDSFQTDSDDEEASPMEVDKQAPHKRRKTQPAAFKKRFKSHNKKKMGFKKGGTVQNGK